MWHNATPYVVVLNNLASGTDYLYKIGGVLRSGRTVWSENATFSTSVQISNLRVEGVTYTSAIIKWDTNVDASGTVYYGATNNYGSTATGGTVGTSHSVSLSGLVPKATYYFVAESVAREDSTMRTRSGEGTFFTGIGITSSISVREGHNLTDFLYQVSWTTNLGGTSRVDWGADETYGHVATGANGMMHAVNIVDPPTAETVHFRVLSVSTTDPSDSTNRTGDSFAVPAMMIANWKVSYRAATNVTITWDTRMPNGATPVPSTSVVRYGVTENEAYTNTATGADGSSHTVDVRNLVSGTTYHFRIESASQSNSNDVARVSNRSFTTKGVDFTGGPNVVPFARRVLFFWNTTALATSKVQLICLDYLVGWVTAYGDSGTAHTVNATGLLPLTRYRYTITSTSLSNTNDSVYWTGTVTTKYEPNDANSGQDAPGSLAAALQIVPGRFTGQLEPGVDTSDFLKLWVRSGQLIRASMQPPSTHDFDLYLYDPFGNLAASSTNPGSAAETVQVLATVEGFWAVKIAYVSGVNYGVWRLELNLTGGNLDQFFVDVGKPGDGNANVHLPGMSLDLSASWSGPANSTVNSTATWDQLFAPPDYRQASTNATFFLNLYNYTYQRYTDYLVTVQYYATADLNVSVYNGGGWAFLATLSGKSSWWTGSFRVESTHLADARSDILGMNVAFRFSGTVQVDRISAVAYGYRTYVGHGSDDKDERVHTPGVLLIAGWQDDGMPYKNATAYADLLLTIPSPDIAYMLTFDFNATGQPVWVEQWNGSAWVKIGRLGTTSGSARLSTDTRSYFDSSGPLPGINLDLRLTAPVQEVTSIELAWSGFQDDIGDGDDGNLTVHEPGTTILLHPLNREWGSPQIDTSGRTFRQGSSFADFYLNSPLPGVDYPLAITYRATLPGAVQQWDGTQWHVIGTLTGDSAWHTVYATALHDWFFDWYGNGNLNARFEFTVAIALDALVAFPDQDRDLLSDFQETYGYAYINNTQFQMGINATSYTHYVVFNAAGPGRYTFEIDSSAFSSKLWIDVDDIRRGEVSGSWDGVTYVNATVCGNGHVFALRLIHGLVTVRSIRFARDATDPTNPDTDADGLSDRTEACEMEIFRFGSDEFATNVNFRLYPTDPLASDTDFDGLTDFQELFSYRYADATTRQVTPAANYTLNVTLPDQGFFDVAMTLRGYPPTGKSVTALVFANGMPVWQYTGSGQWIRTAAFSTRLVKGQNALRVSVGEASGWVNLTSVSIVKNGSLTSPTTWDTDGDGLGDGAEESGATGWILNPVNPDTDGDGVYDGTEVNVLHTDPTNPDTDGDGVGDFEDMYPLSDVVVQITLGNLVITDPNFQYPTTKYYATAGIEGQWVLTKSMSSLSFNLTHTLTVNTRDSALVGNYNITVRRNDRAVVDITPDTLTMELRAQWLYLDESKCYQTSGDTGSPLRATLNYCVKTVKVGKVNSLLVVPTDYTTVFNGSTGMHRYVGEQKFVFVVLNVSGSNAYFGTGMNEIIVPRGIYFSTKFHKLLNDTWSNASSSALVGSEVIGNDDNNTRSLNAIVVQMIVSHNVTAAKAKELLDLLLVNVSGGKIARYMNVTGEFYTMGFAKRVVDLTPYVSVYNTGNYSPPVPPPPPSQTSFWSAFWNTIAGAVQYVWNAVQAVAVYIYNVVAAVARWAMSVAEAFAQAFYAAVKAIAKAIVDAILAIVSFIIGIIRGFLDLVLSPLIQMIQDWSSGLVARGLKLDVSLLTKLGRAPDGGTRSQLPGNRPFDSTGLSWDKETSQALDALFDWVLTVVSVFLILFAVLSVIEIVSKPFMAAGNVILPLVSDLLVSTVIGFMIGIVVKTVLETVFGNVIDYFTPTVPGGSDLLLAVAGFVGLAALLWERKKQTYWVIGAGEGFTGVVTGVWKALALAAGGLMVLAAASTCTSWPGIPRGGLTENVCILVADTAGLLLEIGAWKVPELPAKFGTLFPVTAAFDEVMRPIGLATSIAAVDVSVTKVVFAYTQNLP